MGRLPPVVGLPAILISTAAVRHAAGASVFTRSGAGVSFRTRHSAGASALTRMGAGSEPGQRMQVGATADARDAP